MPLLTKIRVGLACFGILDAWYLIWHLSTSAWQWQLNDGILEVIKPNHSSGASEKEQKKRTVIACSLLLSARAKKKKKKRNHPSEPWSFIDPDVNWFGNPEPYILQVTVAPHVETSLCAVPSAP